MSLVTLAIVNGVLVAALLAGLAYVCSIPFRLDRTSPLRRARFAPEPPTGTEPAYERSAA